MINTLSILVFLALAPISAIADAQTPETPEQLANRILQDRTALSPRVGFAKPNDDVFLMELDINLYQAALDSNDKKLKALVAIKALKTMPHFVREGENTLTKIEKEKAFRENPQYKKLKGWYLELIHNVK